MSPPFIERQPPRCIDIDALFDAGLPAGAADAPDAAAAVDGRRDRAPAAAGAVAAEGAPAAAGGSGFECVVDRWADCQCAFVRIHAPAPLALRLAGASKSQRVAGGGWIISGGSGQPAFVHWVPCAPMTRTLEAAVHLRSERAAAVGAVEADAGGAVLALESPAPGSVTDFVVWRLPAAMAQALVEPTPLERQPSYLWGSHTRCAGAADVYIHLIHGHVYENRYAWPLQRRVCSENDAHAISVRLAGLALATGRPLHARLSRQIVLAVVSRQSPDGAFRHGAWTDRMESHYRLHCSAMHLLMDALQREPGDPPVADALRRAAAFVAAQHETLAAGTWFFHDDLELSLDALRSGPFKWVPSRALGKSEANMLVLNTHLDTGVALHRYAQVTGDTQYAPLVESARASTRAVLGLRSAELLYRAVFKLVGLTFLPTPQAAALPAWKRALKRLTWKFLIPRLPDIKARWPRLVMPGGYIDRELVLRTWAHDYHAVNLMDLARYLRRFPGEAVVRQVLVEGLEFARRSGILARWRELDYQKYALGFWAEALYHVCTLFPTEARYRAWLAEAMLVLEDLNMGQPPSLLGANAEAVPPAHQLPCPSPADARLRVANLGRRGAPELLVVNAAASALPLQWAAGLGPAEPVKFHSADGGVLEGSDLQVPARGWLWARAANSG